MNLNIPNEVTKAALPSLRDKNGKSSYMYLSYVDNSYIVLGGLILRKFK